MDGPSSWKIHIVEIPCQLAKSLQETISSFIFKLIVIILELDSNWNTMQQVRMYSKYYAIKVSCYKKTTGYHIAKRESNSTLVSITMRTNLLN